MLYDINNIDLNRLKGCKLDINEEANNFKNKAYNSFLVSYLNNSNNVLLKNMTMTLERLYNSINKEYDELINYLDSYIDNMVSLESVLSNNSSPNLIKDSTLRNYADSKLSNLPKEGIIIK